MADTAEVSLFSFPTIAPEQTQTNVPAPEVDTDIAVDDAVDESTDAAEETVGESADEVEAEESDAGKKDKPFTTAEIQKALGELRKTNPEAAKILAQAKDNIGRVDAYSKLGKVDELRALKTAVDGFGGVEKVAEYGNIVASVEQTDTMLAEGNPEVLSQLIADAPDGVLKLAPHYLKEVYKLAEARAMAGDTTALNTLAGAIQPHAIKMLKTAGFERVLNALYNAQSADDITAIYTSLKQWYDGESAKAAKGLTASPDINPEMAEFNRQKTEFSKQQDTVFQTAVGTAIVQYTNKELGTRIAPYLANHPNLSANQKADIANALYRQMDKEIKADKVGVLQMKSFMSGKGRDQTKAISHGQEQISAHADDVVDQVMKAYGLSKGKKGAAAAASATAGKGEASTNGKGTVTNPIRVTEKPARDRWDMDKTTDSMIVKGMCILKNGKAVRWR